MTWKKDKKKGKGKSKADTKVVKPKAKPESKPEPEVEVVHSDYAEMKMAPEVAVASADKPSVPKPVPKPEPVKEEGDQAVVSGSFSGQPALCVLSKTPTGYTAQIVRPAPSGPVISPASRYPDLDTGLTWARAVMTVNSVRKQVQVPVADVAKELA